MLGLGLLGGRTTSLNRSIISRCLSNSPTLHATTVSEDVSAVVPKAGLNTVDAPAPTSAPRGPLPLISHRDLDKSYLTDFRFHSPREAWLENFDSVHTTKLGLVPLHPSVWAWTPRMDTITKNIRWQKSWREVNWIHMKNRWEFGAASYHKPWPQKGTGRARHGSTTTAQWKNGGWIRGPRHATTKFRLLHHNIRVLGLLTALSVKFAQDDVKIIDSLEGFPSESGSFLEEMLDRRGWGPSCLIVDVGDIFPRKISIATSELNHVNLLPVYGLNVMAMVRHETLVLTLAAAEEIERKLLFQLSRSDFHNYNTNNQNLSVSKIHVIDYEDGHDN